jgi:peptide methionine sulfoxide reductase msrA/msrB
MRRLGLFLTNLTLGSCLLACSSPGQRALTSATPPESSSRASAAAGEESGADAPMSDGLAYFAGGCFWGVEHFMQQLDGVQGVETGYMSGQGAEHRFEVVRVRFDPARVTYREIARRFFEIHDPTQADGQGPDIGPEYRSAVFYASAAQQQTTEQLIELLVARGYEVVTEVSAAGQFSIAEDRHQDYYERSGELPYCHARVRRFED